MTKSIIPRTPWMGKTYWSLEPVSVSVLILGLVLFGVGESCLVLANLGSAPWTVLSQGVSHFSGINIGWVTFLVSLTVLILWLTLKIKPGLGTILNVIIIALVIGLIVSNVTPPTSIIARIFLTIWGVVLVGIASAIYLTSHKGAGPRDGLLVGLCFLTGWRVGLVRTMIEGTVCLLGWFLGGSLGIGTLLFAFGVGWVMQFCLAFLEKLYGPLEVHKK